MSLAVQGVLCRSVYSAGLNSGQYCEHITFISWTFHKPGVIKLWPSLRSTRIASKLDNFSWSDSTLEKSWNEMVKQHFCMCVKNVTFRFQHWTVTHFLFQKPDRGVKHWASLTYCTIQVLHHIHTLSFQKGEKATAARWQRQSFSQNKVILTLVTVAFPHKYSN